MSELLFDILCPKDFYRILTHQKLCKIEKISFKKNENIYKTL